ncbi:hypothetical protein AOLI_G00217550 [Acnodon oligacanthus]
MVKRLMRRKQLSPQQDAEIYIKMKTDKPGLEEKFISSSKGRVEREVLEVKVETSTARAHQKLHITTGDEVKEALPKNYSVKCTETELTESEEQAEPSMSCIQKKPETDGSSCPVEEEAILQHKSSDAGDDLL